MKEIIPDKLIEQYFEEAEQYLLNEVNRFSYEMTRKWCKQFPKDAGVYTFFIDDKLSYVGETGCLRKRLSDLLDSRNHTLRRTIGNEYFNLEEGFTKANSSLKFPKHVETLVKNWMPIHLKVSLKPMKIGRKEFEDWLQNKHHQIEFLNKRKKRK